MQYEMRPPSPLPSPPWRGRIVRRALGLRTLVVVERFFGERPTRGSDKTVSELSKDVGKLSLSSGASGERGRGEGELLLTIVWIRLGLSGDSPSQTDR
jgi:hypothetical protein